MFMLLETKILKLCQRTWSREFYVHSWGPAHPSAIHRQTIPEVREGHSLIRLWRCTNQNVCFDMNPRRLL